MHTSWRVRGFDQRGSRGGSVRRAHPQLAAAARARRCPRRRGDRCARPAGERRRLRCASRRRARGSSLGAGGHLGLRLSPTADPRVPDPRSAAPRAKSRALVTRAVAPDRRRALVLSARRRAKLGARVRCRLDQGVCWRCGRWLCFGRAAVLRRRRNTSTLLVVPDGRELVFSRHRLSASPPSTTPSRRAGRGC